MLEQEGLLDIAHSSPSEQVAYLLVERSTLLEKTEALEQQLDSSSCLDTLWAAQPQSRTEEQARDSALCACAECHWHEAVHRLQAAHGEIRRLTEELNAQKTRHSKSAPTSAETLKEEMEKVKESEMSELQKAREQNIRLDKEILALRNRVRFLDSERTIFLEREKKETAKSEEASVLEEGNSDHEDNQALHKRCCQVVESIKCQNAQLLHKLHKLEREHEDLVERNEELESLLGETQNQTKDEREQFECEVDELRKKISHLEAELTQAQESLAMANGKATKEAVECQEVLKTHQEKVDVLENKLLEEKEWRKQLVCDLEVTQNALKEEKKELQNSKSELLRLYSELQVLRGAAEERDVLHVTHERLQKENVLLETKVSELSQECEQLNQLLTEEKKHEEKCLASRRVCTKAAAKERLLEDRSQSWEKEREQLCLKLLESNKKMEELEKQIQGNHEEKQLLWEENAQLRKDILALRHQLNTSSTVPVRLKHEASFGEIHPHKPQSPMGSTDGDVKQCSPGGKAATQQQHEQLQQLRQDLQRVQNLCSSAEKELRYEREKNLELKKHNILLQQENIKTKAELRQAQQKLSDASKTCSSLTSQWELSHQKVKELELQLLKQSQAMKQQSSLAEKLAQEKARVAEAEKTITELQRKLKESRHQVQLSETHILGRKQLEGEVREARENEMKVQRQFQEEQRKRKLLDQQVEEFQQQLRQSHEKEMELTQASAELQVQYQQQEARLQVLEEEKRTLSNEHLHCQKYSQKLSEQLLALQQEKETLHSEFGHIMKQVDISIRKHNERKLRHKAKLRRAKETFISEVKQRDMRIRHLEDEIKLLKTQAEKEHGLIRQVTAANEGLHQEKRKLLQRLHDVEEEERSNKLTLSTLQSRVHFLDEENKKLQEQILQLTTQVGVLQRALRSIHNHNLEELKSLGFSECQLQSQTSPPPKARWSAMGLSGSCGLLKAIQDGKVEDPGERALPSPTPFPPSEVGYLNVVSPRDAAEFHKEEPNQPPRCDHV
ncbi:coiled-coil domain-containing protein 30 isoform X2 [Varanus komodoensis]|nr:coiled-coil domain-containing protein 30 isoform X2 [Varanus komodoensis]XP_044308176.1 coiled-coil domain-containing protein 30 isoform X2 [Varanus komodoensis]XP_044308177.1 coiled-coil domain-containing protein 30 isoform X2 [Varanus komodoensis]